MKRLFAYMGITALFTLTIVFYFHLIAISVVCLCSTIFIALGLFVDKFAKSKNIIIFVCLTAIVSSICSGCYTEFSSEIADTVSRIHGNTVHTGRAPKAFKKKFDRAKLLSDLKNQLSAAIAAEEFERAAELRDKIREIEAQ